MNRRILGIGPSRYSGTDGVICEGVVQILGRDFSQYVVIDDQVLQSAEDFYPDDKFDYLVYSGSPWLWDQMDKSVKYKNTMLAKSLHPEAKMIFLGIGSSIYLTDFKSKNILHSRADRNMLRETFKNCTVIVRDSLARKILNTARVNNYMLPCPAWYNKLKPSTREVNVIFYHAPQTGVSSGFFTQERLAKYNKIFLDFNEKYDPEIVVCTEVEIPIARELFGKEPHLIKTYQDTFEWCEKADNVLSGRVHNVIPAALAGLKAGLVPVDSRGLTYTEIKTREFDIADYTKILTKTSK